MKRQKSFRLLWDTIKNTNIHVKGIPKEVERNGQKKIYIEIMA